MTRRNVVPLLEGPRSNSTPATVATLWRQVSGYWMVLDGDWVMDQHSSFDFNISRYCFHLIWVMDIDGQCLISIVCFDIKCDIYIFFFIMR